MSETARFTAAEAAFVLREPVRSVKKALDAGPIHPVLLRRAGTTVRTIGSRDLLYLYLERALRPELTPKARHHLYAVIASSNRRRPRKIELGRLRIDVSDLVDEVDARTSKLAELARQVDFREDGEPLIKGTDIEIHRIASLLAGGLSVEQIMEDYPSLTRSQIGTAGAYAGAYPKQGRPYPATTFKRALAGAGLEALDEVMGDNPPR